MSVLLVSCAARRVNLDSWLYRPVSEAVERWGPPTTVYEDRHPGCASEGPCSLPPVKVYVWRNQRSIQTAGSVHTIDYGSGVQRQHTHPGQVITRSYYRMFWVDQDGKIIRWQAGRQ